MPDHGAGLSKLPSVNGERLDLKAGSGHGTVMMCEVALDGDIGPRSVYSYRVPERLIGHVGPGHLVQVPFGPRMFQGVVLSVAPGDPGPIRLRDLTDLLDPVPCLTPTQLALAEWIASYYACALGTAVGAMLPAGFSLATDRVFRLAAGRGDGSAPLPAVQQGILDALRERGESTIDALASRDAKATALAALRALVQKGWVVSSYRLRHASIAELSETLVVSRQLPSSCRLSTVQRQILDYLALAGGEATMGDLRRGTEASLNSVMRLAARDLVQTYQVPRRRDPLAPRHIERSTAPVFTSEQEAAYAPVGQALRRQDGSVFLLHGVTGSGKTEVYLRAVAETIAAGRQAIVLVPEIGLTPQTVFRFAGRFPGQVALQHSRLSPGERFDEWQRIRRGECALAVGARSAVFSPFAAPGLIVIDEEHDASYKQDVAPRYHTRDVAEQVARLTGAVVLLGSATPDVVSFYRAQQGETRLLTMTTRVGSSPASSTVGVPEPGATAAQAAGLPAVQVVDMRLELKAGNRSIFSRALSQSLQTCLGKGEQAILFLNRRGNATFVNCRDCGYVVKCQHCDIPMTYHSQGERLLCHRCDRQRPVPSLCPQCGSWRIRYFGLGTQKVELEVLQRFPQARVQRYDRDVTAGKLGHEAILDRFSSGAIDVLVGTQIVAKGLDFPRVTLVGAVSADTSINMPDFRAAERTFSLLTQVAGRAGRAALPGKVVIQTYVPTHFAIEAAAQHDYLTFYKNEIRYRQDGPYPPFSRLARLVRSDASERACRASAQALAKSLQWWIDQRNETGIEIIGPAPCVISKARDHYFWQILVRAADVHPLLGQVPSGWTIDVDPMNML